jgi:hypothetical protein
MSQTWKTSYAGTVKNRVLLQGYNDALDALRSLHSGASEPESMIAYMLWADTTSGLLKQRNASNNGWLIKGSLTSDDPYNENLLINGGFDVWQRGSSFTINSSNSGIFTADRFRAWFGGAPGDSVATVSRESFVAGDTSSNGCSHFLRVSKSFNNNEFSIEQSIENIAKYSSKKVTIGFDVKANSNISNAIKIKVFQVFGTGGSATVPISSSNFDVSTSIERKFATLTLPSISGKTIGSGSCFVVSIQIESTATGNFDISCIKIEDGEIATKFIAEPIDETIAKCQRYYQKSYRNDVAPGSVSVDTGHPNVLALGSNRLNGVDLCVRMRATPTITFYKPSSGEIGKAETSAETGTFEVTSVEASESRIAVVWVGAGGLIQGQDYQYHYTASAEL